MNRAVEIIEQNLKNDFKAKCAKEGVLMKRKIEELVRNYTYGEQVKKNNQ